ncbi:DUF6207 family protein [Streptomyces bobili]|uniref:DUF6207 family protein n=1 Tax=Streptomyces bobili TaxID=67280 RepID=UPI0036F56AA9
MGRRPRRAFRHAIARPWTSTTERTTRDPGRPGVRVGRYVHPRQGLTQTSALAGGSQEAGFVTTGG